MLKLILVGVVALLVVASAALWMLRPGGRLAEGSGEEAMRRAFTAARKSR